MNFLDICKRVRQEAGIAGLGPTSVVNQTGELRRIVDWVASTWQDVQILRPDWNWMMSDFSFQTVAGQRYYTPAEAGIAERFSEWRMHTISLGDSHNNEAIMVPLAYEEFRQTYVVGPQIQSRPVAVTSAPDRRLGFGYMPDKAYTVWGMYKKSAQPLVDNGDVPEMPEQFHEILVYGALKKYSRYMAAMEIYADAEASYRQILTNLTLHQSPQLFMSEPMA